MKTNDQPDTIGRYELLTQFATGGMAELYLARERGVGGLERVVVIKRLLPHLADDPNSRDMFLREARLVARLNHPNVVQTYELGEEGGDYYLAMEYLHGSTVRELAKLAYEELGGVPLELAVSIVEQAARGLHAAHELKDFEGNLVGLIHRDVSPQNLMCTDEGYVKLLDFGVAKAEEGREATYSGNIKGKFSYMSPEQLHRESLDRRSDLFALGIVTWELCVGARLFERDGELETMTAITEEETPRPKRRNDEIPEGLDRVIMKALAKDRENRFETVEAYRQELVDVAEREGLLVDEDEIAVFVEEMAGEQLEERRATLQSALERSLTESERARFRHADALGSESGVDQSGIEPPAGSRPHTPDPRRGAPGSEVTATARQGRSGAADWHHRFQLVFTVGAFLLLGATLLVDHMGWTMAPGGDEKGGIDRGPAPTGEPLEMAWAPIATESLLREEFEPIRAYLAHSIDRPIELVVPDSYSATSRKLRSGEVDIAILTPLLFIRTRRAEPEIQPVAVREFDGSVSSDGLLLVRRDSEFDTLESLEGETFCFTDKNSTTGNFLPRVHLRRLGYEPQSFIGEVHWSGNHLQVLRDLVAGTCAAAATYSGSYLTADSHDIDVGQIRQLAVTGHTPMDTVTGTPSMDEELVGRVRKALLAFAPKKDAKMEFVGETLKLTGFREPRPGLYENLEDAVDQNQDILERFGFPSVGEPSGTRDAGARRDADGPSTGGGESAEAARESESSDG